jgi:hypothetical protein
MKSNHAEQHHISVIATISLATMLFLHGCCGQCTLRACEDGLYIDIELDELRELGELEEPNYSLVWKTDNATGEAILYDFDLSDTPSLTFVVLRSKDGLHHHDTVASLELLYQNVPVIPADEYLLQWESEVCNTCTCGEVEKAYYAELTIHEP